MGLRNSNWNLGNEPAVNYTTEAKHQFITLDPKSKGHLDPELAKSLRAHHFKFSEVPSKPGE